MNCIFINLLLFMIFSSSTSPTFHVPQNPSTVGNPTYMNGNQLIKSVSSASDGGLDYSNEVLDMSYG